MRPTSHIVSLYALAFLLSAPSSEALSQSARETTAISELGQHTHFHGIAVDPQDGTRIYLATHHGFFVVSPDGTALRLSTSRDDFMGFTPHPSEPNMLYASGHPAKGGNLGFISSADGGKTWSQVSPRRASTAAVRGSTPSHSDGR